MVISCIPTIFRRSPKPEVEKTASRRPSLFSIKSTKSIKSMKSRNSGGSYQGKRQSQIYELTDRRWYMYTAMQPDGEVEKTLVALPPHVAERLNLSLKNDDDSEPPSPRTASIPIPSEPMPVPTRLPPSPTIPPHQRQMSTATFLSMGTYHDRDHHYEDTITRLYDEDEIW
ncbi:hypothetical protein H072_7303 [Dactylellina haptotyla CBS 200.50]|uniref:Uncharacterized protein n=1 Tax=Dactylellina haptotyla (strain CBS 200.50) TaxID=1284197 RepID=S8BI16_DACHA|nr:hypothetical protein H072_7303 [Dactylellina haptotyla CBS 200.50]